METDASEIRFQFGENWQAFGKVVTAEMITEAERGLARLFPNGELRNARFFDIGSGSGLSALAALRLGASKVDTIDVDEQSVAATRALLSKFDPTGLWSAKFGSVLDLTPGEPDRYDIVYSWGVLHHTGAMWPAIDQAASMVAPGGHLAIALYRLTPMCSFWRIEKRVYNRVGPVGRALMRGIYKSVYCAALIATGRSPFSYIASYKSARGMSWHHDVHDWLGGYPYESTDPATVSEHLKKLGFEIKRVFEHPAAALGLFGSHCDEYVAVRAV